MKKLTLALILIFAFLHQNGQTVSLSSAELSQGKILIKYQLQNPENIKVKADLFSSLDNYQAALKQVSGNIGENIQTGENAVIWDYKAEGKQLAEEMEFEIRIEKIKPKYTTLFQHSKNFFWVPMEFTTKHPQTFYFRLNDLESELIIELHQNGNKLMIIDFITGKVEYTWHPKGIEGKGYQLKLVNKNDPADYITSNLFEITDKKLEMPDFDWKHSFLVDPALYTNTENAIDWTNALMADNYKITLYINNKPDRVIDITDKTSYLWKIPEALERTFAAQLKIEDISNPANYLLSNQFNILDGKYKVKTEIKEQIINKELGFSSQIKVNESYDNGSSLPVIFDKQFTAKYIIVELYKDEKLQKAIDIIENKGFYNWQVNADKGYHYQLKFTEKENTANFIFTSNFEIKK